MVAKVEWHQGELYPRVGFLVTNLKRPAERVSKFYNGRGTADIYQASCVSRVRSGQWWRAGRLARWARRAGSSRRQASRPISTASLRRRSAGRFRQIGGGEVEGGMATSL